MRLKATIKPEHEALYWTLYQKFKGDNAILSFLMEHFAFTAQTIIDGIDEVKDLAELEKEGKEKHAE